MKQLRDEKGMVLLLVLAVVALLTSLLTEFAFSTLVDLRLTETFRDSTRSWYLAKGGIEAGRKILEYDKTVQRNGYDHASEMWGLGIPNYPVGENGAVHVGIDDLSARINVNKLVDSASQAVDNDTASRLYRLLLDLGLPDPADLTAALIDWMDRDDDVLAFFTLDDGVTRINADGAESVYYEQLDPPIRRAGQPLATIDELSLVKGFTPEVLRQVAPYLTIFGDKQVNLNTASAPVLRAMDEAIEEAEAAAIIAHRESAPFKNTQEVTTISGLQTLLHSKFSVEGHAFQITAEGSVGDGRRTASAVVSKDGKQIHYLKVD